MIILTCNWFDIEENGIPICKKVFIASHAYDTKTGKNVIVQCEHPKYLRANFINCEWIIMENNNEQF